MDEKLIGQVLLNQFRVDEFIGSGSMSVVYRVWDLKRSTHLAMKILQGELADDPAMFKYFKRGAKALEKLAHPHIVPFYGLHKADDFTFALEAYIKGPSLRDILRQQQKQALPLMEILCVMKAVCSALGYAHANGVVHCDVKPGNIMVDAGGNVYLTDFGIARHADSTTTTMGAAGTPAYMAPEQIRGEAVNAATDVYAMGIMLFEMLTGQRPFRGYDSSSGSHTRSENIRTAQLTQPPPDPHSLNPAISPAMAAVMIKSLEKNPQDRFQDIMQFFFDFCKAAGVTLEQIPDRLLKYIHEPEPIRDLGSTVSDGVISKPATQRALPFILGGAGLVILVFVFFAFGNKPIFTPEPGINPPNTSQVFTVTERPVTKTPTPAFTPTQAPPTQTPIPTLSPTPVLPTVVIEPRCEELGLSPVTVRAHQPVTFWWRWDAKTYEQVQDHLEAVRYEITLDGVQIFAQQQTDISYVADEGLYRVSWYAAVGALPVGTHTATRLWTWTIKIFDGWDYYGPGSNTVTEYDECVIIVRLP